MARLDHSGFEGGAAGAEGFTSAGTGVTFDTAQKRTGAYALKIASAATVSTVSKTVAGVLGRTYYARVYVRFANNPTTNAAQLLKLTFGASDASVNINTAGKLTISSSGGAVATGTTTLSTGTWYRLELRALVQTGADQFELRLNGVQEAVNNSFALVDSALSNYKLGHDSSTASGTDYWLDDFAFNDDQGSSQNSWPGDGAIIHLKPTADSARGANWTAGAGATTNLWDAVDSIPPAPVALASATNTSQIKNVAKDTTGTYDATLQTYTVGGVGAGDTVALVQPRAVIGGSNATMNIGLANASNPAIAEVTANVSGTIAAAFPTGWTVLAGTLTYAPSVTLGTAPVLRIRKNTSSTNAAMSGLMVLLVEYSTPPSPTIGRSPTTLTFDWTIP